MINQQIATELAVQRWQVDTAVTLLEEGSTVPFIACYRKHCWVVWRKSSRMLSHA